MRAMLSKMFKGLIVASAIGVMGWFIVAAHFTENAVVTISFLNVGQGDAIFIETPTGRTVLIDGGRSDSGIMEQLARAMPWYRRSIDLVVLTHPDDDHGGGLVEVVRRYDVGQVVYTGIRHSAPSYAAFVAAVAERGVATVFVQKPQRIVLDDGVFFDIVYPQTSFTNMVPASANDTSIVARLVYGEVSVLLTGDLEVWGEQEVLARGGVLQSNVLKVGHHGSDSSTSEDFLAAVAPQHAIIQVGADNTYGHPSRRVVRRLERAGVQVWRTDWHGTIRLRTNGKKLELHPHF